MIRVDGKIPKNFGVDRYARPLLQRRGCEKENSLSKIAAQAAYW
jgi:hypothetical protein